MVRAFPHILCTLLGFGKLAKSDQKRPQWLGVRLWAFAYVGRSGASNVYHAERGLSGAGAGGLERQPDVIIWKCFVLHSLKIYLQGTG